MQGVIERAIKEGKAELLTGHKYCPLDSEEVKQLTISSLIRAAEQLGYEGEHDVADRLEHREHDTYVKPLTAYVWCCFLALIGHLIIFSHRWLAALETSEQRS